MTEPYYQDSDATLYLGVARDVLPTLAANSVDLIVTDPPYKVVLLCRRGAVRLMTSVHGNGSKA